MPKEEISDPLLTKSIISNKMTPKDIYRTNLLRINAVEFYAFYEQYLKNIPALKLMLKIENIINESMPYFKIFRLFSLIFIDILYLFIWSNYFDFFISYYFDSFNLFASGIFLIFELINELIT